jgi:hypothetical protein
VDVRCPVCDRNISSSRMEDLSETLRGHLVEAHGFVPAAAEREREARLVRPLGSETLEECVTRTFSSTMCEPQSPESKILQQKVEQWKYPRASVTGERGPVFLCPVCKIAIPAPDDESLSVNLREHFNEVHDLERMKLQAIR